MAMAMHPKSALRSSEIERLSAGIYLMALRALGDAHAAEEVSQETLARMLAAFEDGRANQQASLGAFVRGIARHVIVDFIRASTKDRRNSSDVASTPDQSAADPLDTLVSEEERSRVRYALRGLPAADRELLHLLFWEGLKPREVSARVGEPAGRIRTRKSRALGRLRAAFLAAPGPRCNEPGVTPTYGSEGDCCAHEDAGPRCENEVMSR